MVNRLLSAVALGVCVVLPVGAADFSGLTYAGYREGQSPYTGVSPDAAQVREDLQLVKRVAPRLRTYSARERVDVAAVAAQEGLEVFAGAWVGRDLAETRREMEAVADQAQYAAVSHVVVGNEALLRGDVSLGRMAMLLEEMRGMTHKPVSTAEPWGVWVDNPRLAQHVDFIAAHVLPYWENVSAERAVDYAFSRIALLKTTFPDKKIVITETGWPSDGEPHGVSVPSVAAHKAYLAEFARRAKAEGVEYFIIEGFDQPWKTILEGQVGAHWGIFSADRRRK